MNRVRRLLGDFINGQFALKPSTQITATTKRPIRRLSQVLPKIEEEKGVEVLARRRISDESQASEESIGTETAEQEKKPPCKFLKTVLIFLL